MVHRPGSAPPGGASLKVSRLPSPLGLSQRPRRAFAAPPGDALRHKPGGDKSRIAVSPMILCNNKRNNGPSSELAFKRGILPPPSPEIPNGFSSGSQLTAALLARAAQKLSSASSAASRRKRTGSRLPVTMSMSSSHEPSDNDPQLLLYSPPPAPHLAANFHEILRNSPPLPPTSLLKSLGHKETSASGRVKVMLRVCRGPGQENGGNHLEVDVKKKQVTLCDPAQEHSEESRGGVGVAAPKMFAFDAIFGPSDPQSKVCSGSLNEVLQAVVNGNDACLFSYGYSGLGKTRTMVGNTDDGIGVIPAAISWLYLLINEQKDRIGARFSVRVSALQIAGKAENLHDLLVDYANGTESSGTSPGMYLREDPLFGAQLLNQSELRAPSAEKAAYYLDAALTSKQNSEDCDNVSHFLFTLHVYQYRIDKSGRSAVVGGRSRLHLLDLGGCDRQMQVFGQSKSFRLSLAGLGNVILAIFNGQKHVPYKETKLTRLLRDLLGNVTCRAAMIAHVSTSPSRYHETLATVQLASRIHRLRHKKSKHGAGEDGHQRGSRRSEGAPRSSSSELCTSSSEQSCDTVIFVGGTNGLDVSDEGGKGRAAGAMTTVTASSRPSFANVCKMAVAPSLPTIPSDSPWTSTRDILSPRRHPPPTAKISPNEVSRIPIKVAMSSQPNRRPLDHEQWVDGPSARAMGLHQTPRTRVQGLEMWVDGPQAEVRFLDCGKRAMIQEWIEMQTRLLEVTSICEPVAAATEEETSLKPVVVKDCWIQVTEDEIMAECVALGGLGSLERLPMTMECEEVVDDDEDDGSVEMVDKDHPLRVLSEESLPASFTTVGTEYGSTTRKDRQFLFRRASSRSLQHLSVEVTTHQQEVAVTRSLSETSVAALPAIVSSAKNAYEDRRGFLEELRKPDGASNSNLERHPSAPEVTFVGVNPWFKMGQREELFRPDGVAASKFPTDEELCINILDRFKLDAVSMDDLATSGDCAYESWAWPSPSRQVSRSTPQRKDRKSTANAFCCVGAATGTGSGSLRSSSCGSSLEFITAKDYEAARASAKIAADNNDFAGKQTIKLAALSRDSRPCAAGQEEQKSNVAKKEMNGQHAEGQFSGGSSGYESMARGDCSSSISHPESTNESSAEETLKVNPDSAVVTNENLIEESQDVEEKLDSFEIDVYSNEDLARFERRTSEEIIALRRERSRYFRLKQKQTELKLELALAKSRLMIDESRWSYDLFVEDSMEQSDPSFLEALENETLTLEKRVVACRSRVWMETSFDAIPIKDVEAKRSLYSRVSL